MRDQLMLHANRLMELLAQDKNVLLSGAPATGKTTLLNAVETLFQSPGETFVDPFGPAAFPSFQSDSGTAFAGGGCSHRRVFRTTFHQGTRYRDFVRGLVPVAGTGSVGFEVSKGLLWQASEYAKQPDSAALLIIDEINRGPAVSIFGDMISAFEADKRLDDSGRIVPGKTVTVQILNDHAELVDYQLPNRLYILAAMNQADSSVEPMDAAFLRRWKRVQISPSMEELREYFGVEMDDGSYPDVPSTPKDVFRLAASSLEAINKKICLGRGEAYQLGQGVFMKSDSDDLPDDVQGALSYVADCWPVIDAHVEEAFFNDKEAMAEVLNAREGSFFKVANYTFAGRQILVIEQPAIRADNVYQMMLSLVKS